MTSTSARALSESLKKLTVASDVKTKPKTHTVQDSWEDEADAASMDESPSAVAPLSPAGEIPGTPPTSPASPSVRTKATSAGSPWQTFPPYGLNGSSDAEPNSQPPIPFLSRRAEISDRRPEKTTSVASRLIAAGIGQKAPKRTQEQREYDQAMKLQEKKRRDAAKDADLKAQQEREKAKLAIWED